MTEMATPITHRMRPALDIANASLERGEGGIGSPRATARWALAVGLLTDPADIAAVSLRHGDLLALRDAIIEVLAAITEGRPPASKSVEALNDASAVMVTTLVLDVDRSPPAARERPLNALRPVSSVLARLARSAIAIVGGPESDRLRRCPAARCGRFFLASRPAQRWCSPACGNRTRVARHHERVRVARRDGTSGTPA